MFRKTGRRIKKMTKAAIGTVHQGRQKWGDVANWATMKQYSSKYTAGYSSARVDAEQTAEGVSAEPEDERIYLFLFGEHYSSAS